ncbi:MAG: hypothetical protein ORN98_04475 [Alphaproteobacteria bacterium]|nr:hypothetical protein [Alphaproteobacteria bacterium]
MTMTQINLTDVFSFLIIAVYFVTHIMFKRQSVNHAKEKLGWIIFDLQLYARSQGIEKNAYYIETEQMVTSFSEAVNKLRLYKLCFAIVRGVFIPRYSVEFSKVIEMQQNHAKNSQTAMGELSVEQKRMLAQQMNKFTRCILSLLFFRTPVTIALLPIFALSLVMTFIVMFLALNAMKPIKQHVVASRKFFAETIESITNKQFFTIRKFSPLLNSAVALLIMYANPIVTQSRLPINHDMLQIDS